MPTVLRASAKGSRTLDPTIYPVEEKVGEDILQRWIMELLRPLTDRWLRSRGIQAFVGADQFIYYRPHKPTDRVSPDIYVLFDVRPDARVPSWKTWEKGIVPGFALEIVSKDWEKDYAEAPLRYGAIGVPELIVFDPDPSRHPDGVVWQVYRRIRNRPLALVEVSQADRIRSKALGCFLRTVGENDSLRLRLGTGPSGDALFPTAEEAALADKEAALADKEAALAAQEASVAAREAERAARLAALATADSERTAKEAALRRVAELEAKLRGKLKGKLKGRKKRR